MLMDPPMSICHGRSRHKAHLRGPQDNLFLRTIQAQLFEIDCTGYEIIALAWCTPTGDATESGGLPDSSGCED